MQQELEEVRRERSSLIEMNNDPGSQADSQEKEEDVHEDGDEDPEDDEDEDEDEPEHMWMSMKM